MKRLLRGLLVLFIGLCAGYYLGVTYPEYSERPAQWKESIPFLRSTEQPQPESQPLDTIVQPLDSISQDSVSVAEPKISCLENPAFKERLMGFAAGIEARRFAYRADLGQDCSGIFHKIKDSVSRWSSDNCSDTYEFPDYATTRSSRHIADWYYQRGNLALVEDPMQMRNLIKPGSVMFYSKPGKTYSDLTIEQLTARSQNYNPAQAAIMHIGVVVDVTRDEQGNVIQYTLMHGRNERYPASRTDFHKEVQSRSNPSLPKFGNWSQQWVAIAEVATPAKGS